MSCRPVFPLPSPTVVDSKVIDGRNVSCTDMECWSPVSSPEECNERCPCQWIPYDRSCECSPDVNIPGCQRFYPRPSIEWLETLAAGGAGLRHNDRILMLGDSITWSDTLMRYCFASASISHAVTCCRLRGYELLLRQALDAAGLVDIRMDNVAVNGANSSDVLNGCQGNNFTPLQVLLAHHKPTLVTLFIGTNDHPASLNHSLSTEEMKEVYRPIVAATQVNPSLPLF